MTHDKPTFKDIENALGFRDRTHRHRAAAKHGLPIGSGDPVPTMPELARMVWDKMAEYSQRPETVNQSELREAKLIEEINVLKERNRKLNIENETKIGNMADVRGMREGLAGLAVPLRKCGELLGRKSTITGRDAQQMLNRAVEDYMGQIQKLLGEAA